MAVRITHARFTLSPFSSENMHELGNAVLKSVKDRIHKGLDINDAPAKPLKPTTHIDKNGSLAAFIPYPLQKERKGKQPIRDLTFTGGLMNSLQVVSASEDRAVIASNNPVKDKVLHANTRISKQFGLSPTDKEVMQKKVRALLERNIRVTS
jgi:hypothetical protein